MPGCEPTGASPAGLCGFPLRRCPGGARCHGWNTWPSQATGGKTGKSCASSADKVPLQPQCPTRRAGSSGQSLSRSKSTQEPRMTRITRMGLAGPPVWLTAVNSPSRDWPRKGKAHRSAWSIRVVRVIRGQFNFVLHSGGRNHGGGGAGGAPRGRFMPSASSAAEIASTLRMAFAKSCATGTRSATRTLSIVSCGSKR